MSKTSDLTGVEFGRLTPVRVEPTDKKGVYWLCRCQCGKTAVVLAGNIKRGITRSCGCLNTERRRERKTTHGRWGSPTYKTWASMVERCTSPASTVYAYYGGRGIRVCERWRLSFESFLADMGERPDGMTLDRIDNEKGYEPGNCRWATRVQQMRNTRRKRTLTAWGETLPLMEWCEKLGLPYSAIRKRIDGGMDAETALTTPIRGDHVHGARNAGENPGGLAQPEGAQVDNL